MELFTKIRILNNKYIKDNVREGDIGYVLEDYHDGNYEVQIWNENINPPESLAVISINVEDIIEVK